MKRYFNNQGNTTLLAVTIITLIAAASATYVILVSKAQDRAYELARAYRQEPDLGALIPVDAEIAREESAVMTIEEIEAVETYNPNVMSEEEYNKLRADAGDEMVTGLNGSKVEVSSESGSFVIKAEQAEEGLDLNALYANAPSLILKDASETGAMAKAWLAVYKDKTYHRIAVKDLPELAEDEHYVGWLIKNHKTGDLFSTGKLKYDASTKQATLAVMIDGDLSDYDAILVTQEKGVTDSDLGKFIVAGKFEDSENFAVTPDPAAAAKKASANPSAAGGLMGGLAGGNNALMEMLLGKELPGGGGSGLPLDANLPGLMGGSIPGTGGTPQTAGFAESLQKLLGKPLK